MVQDHIQMYINQSVFNRYNSTVQMYLFHLCLLHEEALVSEYVSVRASVRSSKLHCVDACSQTGTGRDRSCFRLRSPLDIPVHFSIWAMYAYTVQKEVEKQSKNDNFASSVMFKTVVFKSYGTPAWKK